VEGRETAQGVYCQSAADMQSAADRGGARSKAYAHQYGSWRRRRGPKKKKKGQETAYGVYCVLSVISSSIGSIITYLCRF
jgi:hypothetical protein